MTASEPTEAHTAATPAHGALPSTRLALTCAPHAILLGWAAYQLPVHVGTWLGMTLGLLAVLHAAVAVLAAIRSQVWLARLWLTLSLYALALLTGVTIVVLSAAIYLSGLYQDLGIAISAGMVALWCVLALLTVPVSAWGLAYTWRFRAPKRTTFIAATVLGIVAMSLGSLAGFARAEPVRSARAAILRSDLSGIAARATLDASPYAWDSLTHQQPAACAEPVTAHRLTLLVTTLDEKRQPYAACLQAPDRIALGEALATTLRERHAPSAQVKLDLVTGVQRISRIQALLDALALRPGLDGVCGAHACFAPWQLVTMSAFTRYRPLPAVPDAAFGDSLDELAQQLGERTPERATLYRIETSSVLAQGGRATPYLRMRPEEVASDLLAIRGAMALAGQHILRAQRPDGSFRYVLDPFTGQTQDRLNLPRQAGTTLALCELIEGAHATSVAARALDQLASFERPAGEVSAISDSTQTAELGPSALPLIAFASCRPRIGPVHDARIARIARFLLAMQRPDGSFHPEFDLAQQKPMGAYEPLYAGGQAVFALVLVEQLAKAEPKAGFPDAKVLHEAVDAAMSFYANRYWPEPLRSLFFVEENWHCLAARAAIASHRRDDYEQFCLDYVAFKSRIILTPDEGVSKEHVGGYGLSDMFPPHSTPTAGFGEALAAALAIEHARGMPLEEDQARMRLALSFVVRQQWTRDNCFVCAGGEAIGGFPESQASAAIRIDYVQHAMAALGHGSEVLALGASKGH